MQRTPFPVILFLAVSFALYCAVWFVARDKQAQWINVPPVPPAQAGQAVMLGDTQMAYRTAGIMMQNLGDVGGKVTALRDYDYERLGQWFRRLDNWDHRSDFAPMLAAYYYGGTPEGSDLPPIISYLADIGRPGENEKWRWLAQAIFLARYRLGDMEWAQALAYELAALDQENMPAWTKQMPAFILMAKGDKEAAYDILMQILTGEVDKLDPAEIYFMQDYICKRILTPEKAHDDPLCAAIK